MIKNKFSFILALILVCFSAGIAIYFSFFNSDDTLEVLVTREAEAVAVTNITYFDGITASQNIFDELYNPIGLALLGDSLVVADSMCDRIQILDGSYSSYSQTVGMPGRFGLSYGQAGAFIDGFREYAMFMKPTGVFVNNYGDIIVSDSGNHAIRKIIGEFVITIAGNGTPGFQNGSETQAQFNHPRAAVMDRNGYIYVADTLNHVIRRIDPSGNVSLFAGTPLVSGFTDGSLLNAQFFQPSGLYIADNGVLYVADSANHGIRRIENGVVSTIAGRPGESIGVSTYFEGDHIDGSNDIARFNFPRDIALLPNGDILVADSLNHAIRLITNYETRTIVGSGLPGHFNESAENLQLTRPEGIVTNGETLFISDTMNNRIVAIPLTNRVLAGRPSRNQMIAETGLTVNSRFAFRGDIRVFLGSQRVEMGRVQPWINGDSIFVPIRPLLESLGADVVLNEDTGELSVYIAGTVTTLFLDLDYFILRGVMVTTLVELMRLFPYTFEWFPELSLIALHIPQDLLIGLETENV